VQPRPLGATGLTVTPVGLGLAALGRPAYIDLGRDTDLGPDRNVQALEHRCHQVLDAAFAAGVRYLDAARSYGRAEEFLASWLRTRDVDPSEVTVGSKWGYTYVGDWRLDADTHEVKDHSLPALTRQTAETRALLADHLDLYQIHSATLDSGVLEDPAALDELTRLRDRGLVIGLSTSGPTQSATIRRALDLTTTGKAPFACVQSTWNLLEPSAGQALAEASHVGWGVIIKEAVANGRLTPTAKARQQPRSPGSLKDAASAWTRSPWPPSSPTPGPTSSSPAPSPPPSWSPTWPPSRENSPRTSWKSWPPWPSPPTSTGRSAPP
jgi:aryl-alcohol dehydrogenase-like predicted oxidoreductase